MFICYECAKKKLKDLTSTLCSHCHMGRVSSVAQ